MSSLFASEQQFEIKLFYVEERNKTTGLFNVKVISADDKETLNRHEGCIKTITTFWLQPNWKKNNEIRRKCMTTDPYTGRHVLDWPMFEMETLYACLQKWDINDDKGNAVPCTKDTIGQLQPNIARELLEAYWKATSPSEEESGE